MIYLFLKIILVETIFSIKMKSTRTMSYTAIHRANKDSKSPLDFYKALSSCNIKRTDSEEIAEVDLRHDENTIFNFNFNFYLISEIPTEGTANSVHIKILKGSKLLYDKGYLRDEDLSDFKIK